MSDFVVETEGFEGPVGKLLELIRGRELYINDISLAEVTDDYLRYIANNEETLENKAQFVQIAATLVLAKSKSLLPNSNDNEEVEEIEELEDRLRAYRLIQQRTTQFRELFGQNPAFRAEMSNRENNDNLFAPGNTLNQKKLVEAIASCVVELPDESLPKTEIKDTVALKDEIQRLQDRCKELREVSFSALTRSRKKHHKVVSFVAILELAKNGHIEPRQESTFGEITIQSSHEHAN